MNKFNDIERMLISSSLTATMAYIASDGLSGITDVDIEWMAFKQDQRESRARIANRFAIPSSHRVDDKAEWLRYVRNEIQNELTLEMNGLLSTPLAVLDFDIFDISEADAFDSIQRRFGSFGYEFIDHTSDAEWWDENRRNHSTVTDNPEFCRTNQCDGECWH